MNDFRIPVVIFTTENNSVAGEPRTAPRKTPSARGDSLTASGETLPEAVEITM